MSGRSGRRDGERRPGDRGDRGDRDRRDAQPDDEQQRRPGDPDMQESDSLTALKAVLGKVAGLLTSLKLTQDECVSLVEQMYGSVLDMDLKLAGETDEKRKASIQAHIQNTSVSRNNGNLAVEYPKAETPKPAAQAADATVAAEPATDSPAEPAPAVPEPKPKPKPEPKPAPKPELAAPEPPAAPEAPIAAAPADAPAETPAVEATEEVADDEGTVG